MESKICHVCGEDAKVTEHGYYFCHKHKWLLEFDPEELEMVVILKLEGKSPKEIETYYKGNSVESDIDLKPLTPPFIYDDDLSPNP